MLAKNTKPKLDRKESEEKVRVNKTSGWGDAVVKKLSISLGLNEVKGEHQSWLISIKELLPSLTAFKEGANFTLKERTSN